MPRLPQVLAELAPEMARIAAPAVEQVAQCLTEGQGTSKQPLTVPTLLTEANRSAGRDGVRVKPRRETKQGLTVLQACKACGVVLERQDRNHCGDCMPEELRAGALVLREKGRTKREVLRLAGKDPAHSETANRRRGKKVAQAQREFRQWDAAHEGESDPEVFRREILPGLQSVPLGAMARATGLSESYCSCIRRGIKVPHRRHWGMLNAIGLSSPSSQPVSRVESAEACSK